MGIQGLRDTDNFAANVRPESWRPIMGRLYPNSAKAAPAILTALTSKMKSRSVTDVKFHWFEKELDGRRLELHATAAYNGGNIAASAAGSQEVWNLAAGAAAKMMVANTILKVEATNELVLILTDPTSDTQITVIRGFAGSTTAAVDPDGNNINPNLLVSGYAFPEASLAPTGANYDPSEIWNYLQIYRRTYEMSGTAEETETRTPEEEKEMKRECFEYFGVDMERGYLFGKRGTTTVQGKTVRSSNGVIAQIPTANNYAFASGSVTVALLNQKMKDIFKYGSYEKLALAGNQAILAMNEAIRLSTNARYEIMSSSKEYGFAVTRYKTPFGILALMSHPLFSQTSSGYNAQGDGVANGLYYGMDTWMLVLDMDNIKHVYMKNRDVKFQKNLQANGQDGIKHGYIAECGLELGLAKTHYLLRNMYSGAAG